MKHAKIYRTYTSYRRNFNAERLHHNQARRCEKSQLSNKDLVHRSSLGDSKLFRKGRKINIQV